MTIILHTKEEVHSQNNKLSAQEKLKQELSLRRLKRSDSDDAPKRKKARWESNPQHAAGELKRSLHGNDYQLKLLMLFAWEGKKSEVAFRLATEMTEAEKFDDLVFRYVDNKGDTKYRFLQAKHKQFIYEEENKIKVSDLKSSEDKNPFSLQKYFVSYIKDTQKEDFKDGSIKDFIICTNTHFAFEPNTEIKEKRKTIEEKEKWKSFFDEIQDQDEVLNLGGKLYRFKGYKKDDKNDQDVRRSVISELQKLFEEALRKNGLKADDYINKMDDFLDALVFAVEQPSRPDLELEIKEKIGNEFNLINDITYNDFYLYMFEWMQYRKKEKGEKGEGRAHFLTHDNLEKFFEEAKQKIASLGLISSTLLYKAIVKELRVKFQDNIKTVQEINDFLNNKDNKKQILTIYQKNSLLSVIKVCQLLDLEKIDSVIFSDIRSLSLLKGSLVDPINAFKLQRRDTLIIENKLDEEKRLDGNTRNLLKSFYEIVKNNHNKKIILINQQEQKVNTQQILDDLLKELSINKEKKCKETNDDNNSLNDFDNNSQLEFLKKRKIIFQGKEEEVSLDKLITQQDLKKNPQLGKAIEGEVLSNLLQNKRIEIGKGLTDEKYNDVKDYYISRKFYRHIRIKKDFKEKKSKFCVTYNDQINELNIQQNQDIVLVSDIEDNFKKLCDKYEGRNIHWLKREEGDLIWQQSYGSLSKLRKCIDKSSDPSKFTPEEITGFNDKMVIIAAEPGMGKSTVLTHLAAKTKEINPSSSWIVRVNLVDHSSVLRKLKENEININEVEAVKFIHRSAGFKLFEKKEQQNDKDRNQMIDEVLSLIGIDEEGKIHLKDSKKKVKNLSLLEVELFNHFYNQGKIALMFDGFDEISPDYKDKVIELLETLKSTEKVKKLLITTRQYPYVQSALEDKLNMFSYAIEDFSEPDQKKFLKGFWEKKLNIKIDGLDDKLFKLFTDELINKFSESIRDREGKFMGIALHTMMIAEVLLDTFKDFYHPDSQELSSKHKQEISEKLNLATLYKHFIETKFKEGLRKENPDFDDIKDKPRTKKRFEKEKEEFIKNHKILALHTLFKVEELEGLFSKSELQKVDHLIQDIKEADEKNGIIDRISDDGKPIFVHRTFAEYFAAEYFISELILPSYSIESKEEMLKFLLNRIFIDNNYNVIRNFINSKLSLVSFETYFFEHEHIVSELLKGSIEKPGKKTQLHVSAEEGLIEIIKFLLKNAPNGYVTAKVYDGVFDGGNSLHVAAENGHEEVIKVLLDYAERNLSDEFVGFINSISNKYYILNTPLHVAAVNGHEKIVKVLLDYAERNLSKKEFVKFINGITDQYTPPLDLPSYYFSTLHTYNISTTILHLAAENGYEKVVKVLLDYAERNLSKEEFVKFINTQTIEDLTPLHSAAQRGHEKVVRALLSYAKKELSEKEFVKFINTQTIQGATPLYLAAQNGHEEVVKVLLDYTERNLSKEEFIKFINTQTIEGGTPLHAAAENGHKEIVEALLNEGANLNANAIINGEHYTPLKLASESQDLSKNPHKKEQIVRVLKSTQELFTVIQRDELNKEQKINRLIENGGIVGATDNEKGYTLLHYAVEKNDGQIIDLLLEKGADPTRVTVNKGNTPLHLAASRGYVRIVNALLRRVELENPGKFNNFINAQTTGGNTALHAAAKEGHIKVVKILLHDKAEANVKNSQDETPLQLAIQKNHAEVVKFLLNQGVTVDVKNLKIANEEIKEIINQKLRLQEKITKSLECPPSPISGRRRREIGKCELSWNTDIEKIREGEENIRSLSNLKINSDKFINYIKDESISENKRTQLIQLAEQVPITGQSQGLVHKLISNQKFINHLSRVGKISGMTMQVMMAKNVLADAVNGNYQGLAINLGFIVLPFGVKAGENAALKGLHSASEIAYARGFKLAPLVESSLAQYFKVSSSFLARSTSAFIAYDLVKELRNGTKEALVGVVGDSVYLGVDAAELGIEVAEGFGVLEGVSSVTGPIGATIGAVVFVGTDVYQAVKKVENIDRLVHLTAEERFLEGIRAFIGIGTERHIEELIEKKQLYNQLVKQALEYLKQHNDIQRYVFPTGKLVQDTCNIVQYKEQCPSPDVHSDFMVMPGEPTGLGIRNACHKDANGNLFILKEREECITKFKPDSNNMVILDEQKPDIKWSKIRPNNPPEGNLFCIPQGHGNLAPGLAYSCNNAIGVEYSSNRTDNYTFIDLGDGTDLGIGFNNSSNIFLIGNGYKTIHGGEKDDTFILQGNRFEGKIFGRNGANTLDLSKFSPQSKSLFLRFHGNNLSTLGGLIDQISKVITRENKEDIISCKDVTLKYIDGRGGRNENEQDVITIEFDYCHKLFGTTIDCRDYLSGKFTPKVQIMLRDYTTVNNYASKGNFSYFVDQKEGKASVDILSTSKNEFIFNNTLEDIKAINFNSSNVVDRGTIKFTFLPHNTEALISYKLKGVSFILNDGTAISVSKEGNLYALQNSNKSVDEIINSYSRVANNLKMSIFVHSLLNNESIVVGHGKHDVIENNPEYKSHLIGNGGENIFVVTSDKLPIPEIVLYDVDQENKIDTLDLRKIRKQVESDLNVKIKTRIITSGKDLIVQLFYEKDNEVSESNIVQVRLKNGLLTNWYERLHVIMNHVPMKIEEFELRPLPLVFDNNEEIIRIAAEDVDKNNKVIISQKVEDYTFSKLGNDLIMTFNHNASLILSEFYKNKEMETLTIRFANKEVAIKDELNNVRSFDDLKEEYKNSTASIINSFNTTEASNSIEASNSTETRVEPLKRNRRNVESNAKSAASRPASFVNTIVNAFTNAIIGTVQGIISARTSAGYSSSSADDKPSNYKSSVNGYKPEGTANSISQVDAKMDVNGTIMLFDLLIRKVTGQKYISTVDQSISPLEAQGYALNITNRFEKVLNKTAIKSGISLTHLNLDPVAVQSAIVRKIINGRFSEIAKTLYSFAKEACPEYKQTDKFLVHLRSQLEGEKVLQQKVEKPYKDLSQEVSRKVELSKKPDTFLNGTSVVKGISRGIN
ncbi:ankyrin repeat domain-containing protein [Wolbachia pipientis]|uniref:ankyrin repeat domain-containing protein n=1 Tax=Wolbachia pipientis TaxID=955 RepID=UPI0020B723C3|nr:ankyrin repeat domain-containing protein [Wolbachia pipientis]